MEQKVHPAKFAAPMSREESVNENFTAIPKTATSGVEASIESILETTQLEYGPMNEEDAIESGYTDREGHAVSMAREDVKGSPTGAYTDIGAGHSSVVRKH